MKSERNRVKMIAAIVVSGFVAGIIGLALIAPRTICHLGDMRHVKAAADIKSIVYALETFRLDHGAVPTTEEGLAKLVDPAPKYLDRIPSDPWWNEYVYASDGQDFSVASYGADGQPGGDGMNADLDDRSVFAGGPNTAMQPDGATRRR